MNFKKAYFHIGGLIEKYEIISYLLNLYNNEREKFIPKDKIIIIINNIVKRLKVIENENH